MSGSHRGQDPQAQGGRPGPGRDLIKCIMLQHGKICVLYV